MSFFENGQLLPEEATKKLQNSPALISPLQSKFVHFAAYCSPNEYLPQPVEGFAYASIDQRLYIFGGSDLNGQETSDLYCFSLKSGWQKVESQGEIDQNEKPTSRVASAMTACNQKLYLFGGVNEKQGWLNDFYEFDTENCIWKRLSVIENDQNGPTPRDKVALVASRDKIYLYGGFGPRKRSATAANNVGGAEKNGTSDKSETESSPSNGVNETVVIKEGGDSIQKAETSVGNVEDKDKEKKIDEEGQLQEAMEAAQTQQSGAEFSYFDDFYCFDPSTGEWSRVEVDDSAGSPTAGGDDLKKATPPGLAAYTVCALADKLLYFGGKTSNGERTNVVYCFALGLKKWLPLHVRDDSRWPLGRSFHSSVVSNDRYLITFGGRDVDDWERNDLWVLDTNTMQWMLARCEGFGGVSAPCARYGHALTVLPDADSRQHLIIYGGSAELDPASGVAQDVLQDMYIVPVDELIQVCKPAVGDTEEETEAKHQHHLLHYHKSNVVNEESGGSNDEPVSKVARCDDCIDL